jgi:hypothetical protein
MLKPSVTRYYCPHPAVQRPKPQPTTNSHLTKCEKIWRMWKERHLSTRSSWTWCLDQVPNSLGRRRRGIAATAPPKGRAFRCLAPSNEQRFNITPCFQNKKARSRCSTDRGVSCAAPMWQDGWARHDPVRGSVVIANGRKARLALARLGPRRRTGQPLMAGSAIDRGRSVI